MRLKQISSLPVGLTLQNTQWLSFSSTFEQLLQFQLQQSKLVPYIHQVLFQNNKTRSFPVLDYYWQKSQWQNTICINNSVMTRQGKFYAVARGRQPSIYRSWPDCQKQTRKFSGAVFKSFATQAEAEEFMNQHGGDGVKEQDLPANTVVVQFDGASKGNPGAAGCGAAIEHLSTNTILIQGYRFAGDRQTNNQAEFKSLVLGLEMAQQIGAQNIIIQGDSELLIKGLKKQYQIKQAGLIPILNQIERMNKDFNVKIIKHVKREFNTLADKLSNDAIDQRGELIQRFFDQEELKQEYGMIEPQKHIKPQPESASAINQEQVQTLEAKQGNSKGNSSASMGLKRKLTETQDADSRTVVIQFDGGSRGNPGVAGSGAAVLHMQTEQVLIQGHKFMGFKRTNNEAEFSSLIFGLQLADKIGATKIIIQGDSELAIKGLKNQYKIQKQNLVPLFDEIKRQISKFEIVEIRHVRRELNMLADKLSNDAMDLKDQHVQQLVSDEQIKELIGNCGEKNPCRKEQKTRKNFKILAE
eukprot:TRINITY_DN9830_c0_g1_i3.p1 TRINITY_DN9830_c0_g1~~TRINITY_DN9830_c0_g1_i3.p1  ORF type:complete len:527 (-),score=45.44 TRINITY_DN9830_c0_g1_i3:667-2247(-)